MTGKVEVTESWLGLCPKVPAVRSLQAVIDDAPSTAFEGPPDGRADRPETIRRGAGAALSGMKTLIHNPQLLWLPLILGIVLAANLLARLALHQFSISRGILWLHLPIEPWPFSTDSVTFFVLSSLVQTFAIELLTVFCLVFLLAGLILSLSSRPDGPVSFFHGLSMARKYLKPLTGWSVLVALAGTLIYIAYLFSYLLDTTWFQPYNIVPPLARIFERFLLSVLSQFPFNFVLEPSQYVPFMRPAWDWWFISFALIDTLIISAITLLLFVFTMFVIPLLVLEEKSLKDAILGSCTLMRKIWGETAVCVLILGSVVFAASLTYLLFRFSGVGYEWRDSGSLYTSFTFPSNAWIAAALLYVLAISGLLFVGATVGGIAALDLFRSAQTGQKPRSVETEFPG